MVQDIDIKSKRISLFDFDGTLIETASGNTFATDLTVGTGACALAADLLMGKVPAIVRCLSDKVFDSLTPDWLDGRKIKALMPFCIMPGGKVRFSLYKCVEDGVDCCEVSKRFDGGGHAGAAGFVIDVSSDQFKDFLEKHKLTSIQ